MRIDDQLSCIDSGTDFNQVPVVDAGVDGHDLHACLITQRVNKRIPLGIKSHRKESSIGMVMSLGIMFVYYLFMILSDTLENSPQLYPWLIPWIPILGGQLAGMILLSRTN